MDRRRQRERHAVDPNVVALGWVSFFTDMASAMITSILPIFVVYTLHEGMEKLGFVVAAATFVSYAFRILFGVLGDRLGRVKPFVVTGYLISALSKPLLAWADNWQQVAALRGLERMGKAIRSATKDSLIAGYSRGRSGRSFGFHKMMDVAGEMSGALIAFAALSLFGQGEETIRSLFAWTLVPGLLAAGLVVLVVRELPVRKRRAERFDWRADRKLLPLMLLYFLFLLFLFSDSFFLVRAKEVGIAVAFLPLLSALSSLVQTLSSYGFGIWIDRWRPERVLPVAMAFGVASTAALKAGWVVFSFILLALFTVASLNAMRAWIAAEARNRGTVYGIFYAGTALFASSGALLMGTIWEGYGPERALELSLIGLAGIWCATTFRTFFAKR
jgi:MFS family permease